MDAIEIGNQSKRVTFDTSYCWNVIRECGNSALKRDKTYALVCVCIRELISFLDSSVNFVDQSFSQLSAKFHEGIIIF